MPINTKFKIYFLVVLVIISLVSLLWWIGPVVVRTYALSQLDKERNLSTAAARRYVWMISAVTSNSDLAKRINSWVNAGPVFAAALSEKGTTGDSLLHSMLETAPPKERASIIAGLAYNNHHILNKYFTEYSGDHDKWMQVCIAAMFLDASEYTDEVWRYMEDHRDTLGPGQISIIERFCSSFASQKRNSYTSERIGTESAPSQTSPVIPTP